MTFYTTTMETYGKTRLGGHTVIPDAGKWGEKQTLTSQCNLIGERPCLKRQGRCRLGEGKS